MLDHRLETVRRTRSYLFSALLEGMLRLDPRNRLSCGEVKAFLECYEPWIEKMNDFRPTY
jgi:hypothetical protein